MTAFQAEVYVIKACTVESLDWAYRNKTSIFYTTVKLQLKHLIITRSRKNWFGTAINPSQNWLSIMGFKSYECRVRRVLKVIKLLINWQDWDLNVLSQNLNQLAEFQQGLPRRLSGTGQTETTENIGCPSQTQTRKGFPTRTICQKNQGTVKTKQKPVTVGDRTLSPERTPFQNEINKQSHLRMVPIAR
jgi:hypothetical protein